MIKAWPYVKVPSKNEIHRDKQDGQGELFKYEKLRTIILVTKNLEQTDVWRKKANLTRKSIAMHLFDI